MRSAAGCVSRILAAVTVVAAVSVNAHESAAQLVSPEVHSDRSVTFRVHAPHADSVFVKGIEGLDRTALVQGQHGVWSVTVGPLPPELYSYVFKLDGTDVVDRHNRDLKSWFFLESLVEIPGDPPLIHEQLAVPHGAVTHHIYYSQSAGRERGTYVYTPPGYTADREDPYPVLFLLHGFGDDEEAWPGVGRANLIADNLLDRGLIVPMVIVMPYGHPEPVERRLTEDYRVRNEVGMERDVIEDLLPYIQDRYNVSSDRGDRAVAGLSMGGGQSIRIGLRNLDSFGWIGAFSAAAPTEDLDESYGFLTENLDQTNEGIELFWIACGRDDFLVDHNESFRSWLDENGIVNTYVLTDGAHTWFVWREYLSAFLQLIFRP